MRGRRQEAATREVGYPPNFLKECYQRAISRPERGEAASMLRNIGLFANVSGKLCKSAANKTGLQGSRQSPLRLGGWLVVM